MGLMEVETKIQEIALKEGLAKRQKTPEEQGSQYTNTDLSYQSRPPSYAEAATNWSDRCWTGVATATGKRSPRRTRNLGYIAFKTRHVGISR